MYAMLRYAAFVIIAALVGNPALAQSTQSAASSTEPLPGDHWTYEVWDEIVGKVSRTRATTLTDVTPTRIAARYTEEGDSTRSGNVIYDRSWNVVDMAPWRYSPHDGLGVQAPLAIGKTWSFQGDGVNNTNGATEKIKIESKVVGQETVATRAGTFETFKIETLRTAWPVKDPTRVRETAFQTWYAPAIDRWVKRTVIVRMNKLVMSNETIEMTVYDHKPGSH
jgi:hypothetical protein